MDLLKKNKIKKAKKALFNPYINGISSYDLAFLSSKRFKKNKNTFHKKDLNNDYFVA